MVGCCFCCCCCCCQSVSFKAHPSRRCSKADLYFFLRCVKKKKKICGFLDSQRRKDPYVDTVLHVCPSSCVFVLLLSFNLKKKRTWSLSFLRLWAVRFNLERCYNLRAHLSFANKAVTFLFISSQIPYY